MQLSVIVPTIPERHSSLSRLLCVLGDQLVDLRTPYGAEVIVVDGPGLLGDKIGAGLAAARGLMSVVVDDDDMVIGDYLRTLAHAARWDGVDFIGYRIAYTVGGRFSASISHRHDGDNEWVGWDRGISPKCPFRTALGRQVPFGNDFTADREWIKAMAPLIRTGSFVDRHMYHYDFSESASTFLGDGRRDVGEWPYDRGRFRWLSTTQEDQ